MNWMDEGALFSQIGAFLSEDLGRGDITKKLTVRAHKFSGTAAEKIAAAGGVAEVIS